MDQHVAPAMDDGGLLARQAVRGGNLARGVQRALFNGDRHGRNLAERAPSKPAYSPSRSNGVYETPTIAPSGD